VILGNWYPGVWLAWTQCNIGFLNMATPCEYAMKKIAVTKNMLEHIALPIAVSLLLILFASPAISADDLKRPFSPSDCGVTDRVGTPKLQQYCARLRQKMIDSDPGHGLIGKLEKADPIEGEPASQHYYWIGGVYFEGNSEIGRKILRACEVGRLCAAKVVEAKNWEHNVGHATFWIVKIIGEPIGE
jgi:hypothetical protein